MFNHFGGRKKKESTFSWSKLIPLLPPDLSQLIPIESSESVKQETTESIASPKIESTNTSASNQESVEESKKLASRITIDENRTKKVNPSASFKQKSGKNKSSVSITSLLNTNDAEKTEEEEQEDHTNKPVDKFAFDDLMVKWNNYANRIKNVGKTNLHATITGHLPELKPNFIIELKINNSVQEELLQGEKLNFLNYLRKELNNHEIQLKTVIISNHKSNNPYTTRDKYEKLAEKNPALNKLKDLLKLDLDY
ncbi:hypothetical protein OAW23_03940 [Flavobacteriales bacterium]|nr:hypothetical protein [Flavobacteriales bacterium]